MISPAVWLLAAASVLAAAAIAVSLFAVWRSQAFAALADERARSGLETCQAATAALERTVEELAGEFRVLGQSPAAPKASLNVCKRSQALRMHRQGASPERIAAVLEAPLQEIELLIKVHRIVLRGL